MIQTFLCIGGPLDGHKVTEQYAGSDYLGFNCDSQPAHSKYTKIKGRWMRHFLTPKHILVWKELFKSYTY
jgi:hypothetical protein